MRVSTRKATRNGHDIASNWFKIKDALSGTVEDARDSASEMMVDSIDNLKVQSIKAQEALADYTARKPFKSLGIAITAGFVLGFLFRK